MGIAVLGPLRVDDDEITLGRRDRTVLAALAVHPGDEVRTERLFEVLWGETPPASAAKVVQGCVVRLRKILGAAAIATTTQGYRLALPRSDIDSARFEEAVERGTDLLAASPDRAEAVLRDALASWRGPALPELEEWEPGRVEADRLSRLRLEAEEAYVDAALRCGDLVRAHARALEMVDREPLRERRWLLLARSHYQAGGQAEALATIRRLRAVLADELGLDAGAEAGELEQAILRQDPGLRAPDEVPVSSTRCPYPGLAAYDVDDSATFFGRDADVSACLRRLREESVLAVVGPSGSGKSSVLRAGVAASLRRDGRPVVVLTPGDHPVRSLAAVTTTAATVLVVDQCEEAFTLCDDEAERAAFLDALAARPGSGQLVLSMRADHLADLAAHPTFARVVERGLYLLGAMAEPDLREAIEGPARRAGLLVEPGLVDLLVNEVERQPGALPILSHTLRETWRRREGRTLTLAAYQDSGGIRGAVAMSAEAVYAAGDEQHRAALRDLMLRLVTLGEDGVPLRTRLPRRAVVRDEAHDDVLDLLVASRLVTSDEGVVDLTHEALARAWPRLRGWLEEDVDGQRIRQHLTVAAEAWDALGRPDSELYRGPRLAAALGWRRSSVHPLPDVEAAFLDAGERFADAERLTAEARARRQARVNRTLRGLLGATAVLLLAAVLAGTLAMRQAVVADRSRADAVSAEKHAGRAAIVADARRLGARALSADDISLSLLLAIEGVRIDDSEESRADLVAATTRHPQLVASSFSPDGHLGPLAGGGHRGVMASSDGANRVVFLSRNLQPFGRVRVGRTHRDGHDLQVRFDPAGTVLAAAPEVPEDDGRPLAPVLIDTFTHQPLAHQPSPVQLGPAGAVDLAFSGDGRRLAALYRAPGEPPAALVWDLRSHGRPVRVVLPAGANGVALDRSGAVLFASSPLRAYDVSSGRVLWRDPVRGPGLDVDRGGQVLLAPAADGLGTDVLVVRAADGAVLRRIAGHDGQVGEARFSPDGSTLAVASSDGVVTTWATRTGLQEERLETGPVTNLAYSILGSYVMTSSTDGSLRLWDVAGLARYVTRLVKPSVASVRSAATVVSADGRAVASTWTGSTGRGHLWLWNTDTGAGRTLSLTGSSAGTVGAWTEDRSAFVTAGREAVRRWDAQSGRVTAVQHLGGDPPVALVALPDRLVLADRSGSLVQLQPDTLVPHAAPIALGLRPCCLTPGPGLGRVVAASAGGRFAVVDLPSGRVVRRTRVSATVHALAATPVAGSGRVVVGTDDGRLVVLDTRSGRVRQEAGPGHQPAMVDVALDTDGKQAVTTAADGTVRLWDASRAHLLLTMHGAERSAVDAAFLIGDRDVLLASQNGGVYRWDTTILRAMHFACRAAGRNLTRAEWTVYVGDRPYQRLCTLTTTFADDPVLTDLNDVDAPGPDKG